MSHTSEQYLGCPVQFTRQFIAGKWQMGILWSVKDKPLRFNEIKKRLPDISDKSLTKELDFFIEKKIIRKAIDETSLLYSEYCLTEFGQSLIPIITTIVEWGYAHFQDEKINKEMNLTPIEVIQNIETSLLSKAGEI
ncbi:MAG TPA: helix-turn-helix domain-containing protein [Chitinophagaceae bacterium]|nr:helix-turn-helix domain-containing protein [Chitinophagaceae bacterium]